MQTHFTEAQRADPDIAEADGILRSCVHCGFCTATCPTYVLLGDEADSPRGRIYLIKEMLETGRPADARTTLHVDRCLSCLSCMTTCPSGVHYMHLVDLARARIEETYKRPLADRMLRGLLARLVPYPRRFRLALKGAALGRAFVWAMPGRLKTMVALAPKRLAKASPVDRPQVFPAEGERRKRVALLTGCAQTVLAPQINEATVRLLTRHGCEVVVAKGAGCCGALAHHMGRTGEAHAAAAANIRAWCAELDKEGLDGPGLDAVVINASGCGTTVKDYGYMFREDPVLAGDAARIAALTQDVTELMSGLGLQDTGGTGAAGKGMAVAYHSACSMQHGQGLREEPKALLAAAGFTLREPAEAHLCCGSAGTYNMLQPALAGQLRDRKVANLERTGPHVIATGNIGCLTQIAGGTAIPVVHTAELLDWATGGPMPPAIADGDG
ncbi:MAG TPA: glycolate oxidase subunit GlcF [Alphaproteobacteria bacterium]|nr:glycolate oxidase subunit GlcF [Alphaproteobacteria bacterium]